MRGRTYFLAFAIPLAAYAIVVVGLAVSLSRFASSTLVPSGTGPDLALVVRAMQAAYQFAALLFAGIALIATLVGFFGFKSVMERIQEKMEASLQEQIQKRLAEETVDHEWRSEAIISGRLGYVAWRISEMLKDSSFLDTAITDTKRSLDKMKPIVRSVEKDAARIAVYHNNLAWYYASRYAEKRLWGDKSSALEHSRDCMAYYHKFLDKERDYDIPFGAEEFAETRLHVLVTCETTPQAALEGHRICAVLEEEVGRRSAKRDWLQRLPDYKQQLDRLGRGT